MEARIPDREDAGKWPGMSNEAKIFVDASYRNNNASVGLYWPLENQGKVVVEDRRTIALGHCEGLTATHIQIKAISPISNLGLDWPLRKHGSDTPLMAAWLSLTTTYVRMLAVATIPTSLETEVNTMTGTFCTPPGSYL
jgi:hypothetical protein